MYKQASQVSISKVASSYKYVRNCSYIDAKARMCWVKRKAIVYGVRKDPAVDKYVVIWLCCIEGKQEKAHDEACDFF